ncbi:alanine--tRNA ligase, cytoplasmic [Rhipicephalus sanguineus]|uniref:alanine--tRNA ligase, cytoplasmic n=1 Tax=Rhipicephalus sanguineus TaxID=34632 RepID=UPI0018951D97|nr:alanine--tRNA ligase, cytoplasmic [Rhipicephalus sanguineus]
MTGKTLKLCGTHLTWLRMKNMRGLCTRPTRKFSAREARQAFVDYFVDGHGHQFVPSSSVVPSFADKSLLFTNSGMNQFKGVFLGTVEPSSPLYSLQRAANYQKCIRVGGKHNDLDEVGKDLSHHTFFEMLGNWSFGDYFKKEACTMAWELLTKVYQLPKERLYVTYFAGDPTLGLQPDEECRHVWLEIGVPEEHILPFGMKENFWEMGSIGPCGPCTEIHIDLVESSCSSSPPVHRVNAGHSDMVELWNLVFMEFNRGADGRLHSLPKKHVDTGMGLERLAAVLQNVKSNYDTDLFSPLITALQKKARVNPYSGLVGNDCFVDIAYRTAVDHARMFTVAISDGVLPEHADAGNKLRRIIRKASHAVIWHLKCDRGTLALLAEDVQHLLGDVYPGINIELVKNIVNAEEDKYLHQMSKAEAILNEVKTPNVLPGHTAWELYVQHGLQKDLITDLATRRGLSVDWIQFEQLFKEFQEKSASGRTNDEINLFQNLPDHAEHLRKLGVAPTNTESIYFYTSRNGVYEFPSLKTTVEAVFCNGQDVTSARQGEHCLVVTNATNFYFENGGQVSDTGCIKTKSGEVTVHDVKNCSGFVFHKGVVTTGVINKEDEAEMWIDEQRRLQCMIHHTATHCLNAALRTVLESTEQRSSLVDSEHLRFDFICKKNLTSEQIEKIQDICRDAIQAGCTVARRNMPLENALTLPDLVKVPNEVYPKTVSVIRIGNDDDIFSQELCCGTHVSSLSDLGEIVVTSHQSVGTMVRSIRAVAGPLAAVVHSRDEHVQRQMCELVEEVEALNRTSLDDYVIMAACKRKLTEVRKLAAARGISLLLQRKTETELLKLERHIDSIIRKYNQNFGVPKVLNMLDRALENWKHTDFIVACLDSCMDGNLVSKLASKKCSSKPYFVAVYTNPDQLRIDCAVPKEFLTSTFQAEAWVKAVGPYVTLHNIMSSRTNMTETYCYVRASFGPDMDLKSLEQAAVDFAKGHCPGKLSVKTSDVQL